MGNVNTFFDIAVSGIGLGALYALVAIGFSIIYKITGVLNFAQGQVALVGAYGVIIFGTSTTLSFVLPPLAAVLVTIVVGVILGFLLERLVFRQFIGEPVLSVIIVTLALGSIIDGFLRWAVGTSFKSYPAELVFTGNVSLPLDASINTSFAIGVVLSVVVVFVLMLFFRHTVMGSILRASASDQQAAMVLGVSVERTIVVAWTLSIGVTAIGGILFGMANGGASLSIESVGIIIFAAVVFGGLDSILGAFIGSITVGLLQELGAFYGNPVIGPGFGEILPLIFLMVVIFVKPYGLFGTERIERL